MMCSITGLQLLLVLMLPLAEPSQLVRTPTNQKHVDAAVMKWLIRFESVWRRLGEQERSDNVVSAAGHLVSMSQCESALTLCDQIESVARRRDAIIALAGRLASERKLPEARYVASLLKTDPRCGDEDRSQGNESYQAALGMIAVSQGLNNDFEGAKTSIQQVDDVTQRALLWFRLARIQASLGYCNDAMASVEAVTDSELVKDVAVSRKWTLEEIDKCRSAKTRKRPNAQRPGLDSYLEGLRAVAGVFAVPMANADAVSMDELETRLASVMAPTERASQWRRIAWENWRAGNLERCRKATIASKESIAEIPDSLGVIRSAECALLADLCFTTGDRQTALDLVRLATSTERSDVLSKGARGLISGPLMISVLVRADSIPAALEVANRDSSRFSTEWEVLGAMCAFCDKIDALEKHRGKIRADAAEAAVCIGVAYGLYEKQCAIQEEPAD